MALNQPSDTILTGGNLWLPYVSQQLLENDFHLSASVGEPELSARTINSLPSSSWITAFELPIVLPDWSEDLTLNENIRLHFRVSFEHRVASGSGGYKFRLTDGTNTGSDVTPGTSGSFAWESVDLTLTPTNTWPTGSDSVTVQIDYGIGAGSSMQVQRTRSGRLDTGWYVYEV